MKTEQRVWFCLNANRSEILWKTIENDQILFLFQSGLALRKTHQKIEWNHLENQFETAEKRINKSNEITLKTTLKKTNREIEWNHPENQMETAENETIIKSPWKPPSQCRINKQKIRTKSTWKPPSNNRKTNQKVEWNHPKNYFQTAEKRSKSRMKPHWKPLWNCRKTNQKVEWKHFENHFETAKVEWNHLENHLETAEKLIRKSNEITSPWKRLCNCTKKFRVSSWNCW